VNISLLNISLPILNSGVKLSRVESISGKINNAPFYFKFLPFKCRFRNSMRRGEKVTNQYRYQVKCQEHIFEKYLDDMGVLVVDFFDTQKNQVVGTSKIMMKLYIKR
jgi:hypothetical protein